MKYKIEFKPRAMKDLRSVNRNDLQRILEKIRAMENDLVGNVKHLTDFEPHIGFVLVIIAYYLMSKMTK